VTLGQRHTICHIAHLQATPKGIAESAIALGFLSSWGRFLRAKPLLLHWFQALLESGRIRGTLVVYDKVVLIDLYGISGRT
jgi:hypothetical protein